MFVGVLNAWKEILTNREFNDYSNSDKPRISEFETSSGENFQLNRIQLLFLFYCSICGSSLTHWKNVCMLCVVKVF